MLIEYSTNLRNNVEDLVLFADNLVKVGIDSANKEHIAIPYLRTLHVLLGNQILVCRIYFMVLFYLFSAFRNLLNLHSIIYLMILFASLDHKLEDAEIFENCLLSLKF